MACSIDFQALKYDYILIFVGIVCFVFNYFFYIFVLFFVDDIRYKRIDTFIYFLK